MKNQDSKQWLKILSWGTGFSMTVVGCAYLGLKAGTLMDTYYGTYPWGLIGGAFFGLGIPFLSAFRFLFKLNEKEK